MTPYPDWRCLVKARSSWDITEGCMCNMGKTTFVYVGVEIEGFLTN